VPGQVGLIDVGVYMPPNWMPAAEIAAVSGIDETVLIERFGLDGKHTAGPEDHISTMGAKAARQALDRAGVDATEVDVVAYFGSMGKDYQVWSASPKIQQLIGATDAWALEMSMVSCGAPVALHVAAAMMRGDPAIDKMLIVGGSRESHLLDYTNHRSRFMFNFGDGAAAALLGRGPGVHEVIATRIISDGAFADDVAVFGGGTRLPASRDTVDAGRHYLDVADPAAMKERLDPVSGPNFLRVVGDVCAEVGVDPKEVALVALLHTKRSFYDWIIDQLDLAEERVVYLRRHGHMSGIDPLVGIDMHRESLRAGDLVLCLSAGTGYTWAATMLRW
jgi:3-oxoacyl-[acyl-carrier-protein] synthase-3